MTYNRYRCTPVRYTAEHPGRKFWWKLDFRGRSAGENQAVKYSVRNRLRAGLQLLRPGENLVVGWRLADGFVRPKLFTRLILRKFYHAAFWFYSFVTPGRIRRMFYY